MNLPDIYRCLADGTRLRMLHLLARGPLCVCHFQSILGVSQVAVSKHLAYLRRHGVVTARRHEQWMIYQLPEPCPVELSVQLRCLRECAGADKVCQRDVRRLGEGAAGMLLGGKDCGRQSPRQITRGRKIPGPFMKSAKPTVLILCTGNSCRSHMAEGILRAAAGDLLEVRSAGSRPAGFVHPLAIRVMGEIGLDISGQRSKSLTEFLNQPVETVITVCGKADAVCPVFPGQVNRHHWPFDDPARAEGSEEEKLREFRRVRDELRRVFEAYAAGCKDVGR